MTQASSISERCFVFASKTRKAAQKSTKEKHKRNTQKLLAFGDTKVSDGRAGLDGVFAGAVHLLVVQLGRAVRRGFRRRFAVGPQGWHQKSCKQKVLVVVGIHALGNGEIDRNKIAVCGLRGGGGD